MRTLVFVLQQVLIDFDGGSSIEDTSSNVRHVLAEPGVLILDLVGEFTSVTENDDGNFSCGGLDLLESCRDEYGGFTYSLRTIKVKEDKTKEEYKVVG